MWRLLWGHRGVFEGEYITTWIKQNIAEFVSFHFDRVQRRQNSNNSGGSFPAHSTYENFTFRQLHERVQVQRSMGGSTQNRFKDLFIIATDITHQRPEVFSYETTPDWSIWEAVRASMSIPIVFDP
jgi:predicted acylesterase/phospholipase RssA